MCTCIYVYIFRLDLCFDVQGYFSTLSQKASWLWIHLEVKPFRFMWVHYIHAFEGMSDYVISICDFRTTSHANSVLKPCFSYTCKFSWALANCMRSVQGNSFNWFWEFLKCLRVGCSITEETSNEWNALGVVGVGSWFTLPLHFFHVIKQFTHLARITDIYPNAYFTRNRICW